MKLHDLQPAEGPRQPRTRVGRGIAAGKGKTAGRGTKGQKARAGGSIPPWFEGGQTPLHMRIPKLRGFKNRFKIEYEVVNVGAIGALAERGAFEIEAARRPARQQGVEGRPGHDQPGHPACRRARPNAEQAAQDPRRRRAVGAALRRRRRVHRLGAGEDRGRRRQRQRPRGPEAPLAALGVTRTPRTPARRPRRSRAGRGAKPPRRGRRRRGQDRAKAAKPPRPMPRRGRRRRGGRRRARRHVEAEPATAPADAHATDRGRCRATEADEPADADQAAEAELPSGDDA